MRVEIETIALPLLVRDSFDPQMEKFMDVKERRQYIKERCLTLGSFTGHKKEIYSCLGKWYVSHNDQFGTSNEYYGDNLDEAVSDYVSLEEAYGLDEI